MSTYQQRMKKSEALLRCLSCYKRWDQEFPSKLPVRCKVCGSFEWVEDKMNRRSK
jgi:hypothetical protein